ncbi:MAG: hypothetical protein V1881_02600 [Candidatus Micrarchaeota archaeon]
MIPLKGSALLLLSVFAVSAFATTATYDIKSFSFTGYYPVPYTDDSISFVRTSNQQSSLDVSIMEAGKTAPTALKQVTLMEFENADIASAIYTYFSFKKPSTSQLVSFKFPDDMQPSQNYYVSDQSGTIKAQLSGMTHAKVKITYSSASQTGSSTSTQDIIKGASGSPTHITDVAAIIVVWNMPAYDSSPHIAPDIPPTSSLEGVPAESSIIGWEHALVNVIIITRPLTTATGNVRILSEKKYYGVRAINFVDGQSFAGQALRDLTAGWGVLFSKLTTIDIYMDDSYKKAAYRDAKQYKSSTGCPAPAPEPSVEAIYPSTSATAQASSIMSLADASNGRILSLADTACEKYGLPSVRVTGFPTKKTSSTRTVMMFTTEVGYVGPRDVVNNFCSAGTYLSAIAMGGTVGACAKALAKDGKIPENFLASINSNTPGSTTGCSSTDLLTLGFLWDAMHDYSVQPAIPYDDASLKSSLSKQSFNLGTTSLAPACAKSACRITGSEPALAGLITRDWEAVVSGGAANVCPFPDISPSKYMQLPGVYYYLVKDGNTVKSAEYFIYNGVDPQKTLDGIANQYVLLKAKPAKLAVPYVVPTDDQHDKQYAITNYDNLHTFSVRSSPKSTYQFTIDDVLLLKPLALKTTFDVPKGAGAGAGAMSGAALVFNPSFYVRNCPCSNGGCHCLNLLLVPKAA